MISEQTSPVEMFAVLIEIKLDGHVEISGDFEREKNSLWKMGFTVISFFFLKKQIGTYSYLSTSLDTSVQQLVNANIYSAKHMKETQCS